MTRIALADTKAAAPTVARICDVCGQSFTARNSKAAAAMLAGKLRVCNTCQRQGARTQLPYSEYIKSDGWKIRRQRALALAENRCQVCNSPARLQVHHRTYERLGHERDADLIVLCHDCHTLFHDHGELKY